MKRMKVEPTYTDPETGLPFRWTGTPCCPYCAAELPKEHGGVSTLEYVPEAAQIATEEPFTDEEIQASRDAETTMRSLNEREVGKKGEGLNDGSE